MYLFVVSIGSDNKIVIWNVGTGEPIAEMEFPDIPLSASWSWDGSKLVASFKDRKVRIIDPRKGSILHVSSEKAILYHWR